MTQWVTTNEPYALDIFVCNSLFSVCSNQLISLAKNSGLGVNGKKINHSQQGYKRQFQSDSS